MKPDVATVPETDIVIDRQPFDFQAHDWQQEGYTLSCETCPLFSKHGTTITPGMMVIGKRGEWQLVPEGRLARS